MPATAPLPITPVLGHLRDLIGGGESGSDPQQVASLMRVLAAVPDPRKRRGVRHRLVAVLVMSVCAVLGGMRSFVAIAQWARDSVESCPQLRDLLGGITVAPAGGRPGCARSRRLWRRPSVWPGGAVLPELKDCAPGFGRQSAGVGGSVRSSTVSCVDQASCVVSKPAGQGAVGPGRALRGCARRARRLDQRAVTRPVGR
jgi:hypothetical protein